MEGSKENTENSLANRKTIFIWPFLGTVKARKNSASNYFWFSSGCPNSWMIATKIWKITWKKKGIISCRFLQVKSGTFWIQFSRDTILHCTETSKETIFCKGTNIWHFLYTWMCLFFPYQTLISVLSLGNKLITEHRKERFNIDDIFPVKNGIRVFRVHPQSFSSILNIQVEHIFSDCDYEKFSDAVKLCYWRASICIYCLNFDCLCCFKRWKSTRNCQISDSRTTRSGSYFAPHPFRGTDKKLSSRKVSFILQKNKMP